MRRIAYPVFSRNKPKKRIGHSPIEVLRGLAEGRTISGGAPPKKQAGPIPVPEDLAALQPDELGGLEASLKERFHSLKPEEGQAPTAEALEEMDQIAQGIKRVRAEAKGREEAAAQIAEKMASLEMEIEGPKAEETPPEPEPEKPAEEPEPNGEEPPAEEPKKEEEPQPQARAASAKPEVPSITLLKAPKDRQPLKNEEPTVTITAAGDVAGWSAGQTMGELKDLAKAMQVKHRAVGNTASDTPIVYPVGTIHFQIPEERKLMGNDLSSEENQAKIDRVLGPEARVASGGLCTPLEGYYRIPGVAVADRPFRDALPGFQADRGGVRYLRALTLSDASGAVDFITEANDETGGATATKNVLTVTCPEEQSTVVAAISRRLRFGNWNERFSPELVEHYVELAMAAQAREAEGRLLDAFAAFAVDASTDDTYGAARSLLSMADRAFSGYRYRHRMSDNAVLRAAYPVWTKELIRADLARSAGHGDIDSFFRVTDEQITAWFRARNIAVTWLLDAESGETGQAWTAQGDGAALSTWPSEVLWYLWYEGSLLYLDAGTLDFGIVRDSTLNATNDFEMMAETFENIALLGNEVLRIRSDSCADGTYAPAGTAISCVTGS